MEMKWVMSCSKCNTTFEVDVGISTIFRRSSDTGTKTPCPSCGNTSFNRILEAKDRGGKERRF